MQTLRNPHCSPWITRPRNPSGSPVEFQSLLFTWKRTERGQAPSGRGMSCNPGLRVSRSSCPPSASASRSVPGVTSETADRPAAATFPDRSASPSQPGSRARREGDDPLRFRLRRRRRRGEGGDPSPIDASGRYNSQRLIRECHARRNTVARDSGGIVQTTDITGAMLCSGTAVEEVPGARHDRPPMCGGNRGDDRPRCPIVRPDAPPTPKTWYSDRLERQFPRGSMTASAGLRHHSQPEIAAETEMPAGVRSSRIGLHGRCWLTGVGRKLASARAMFELSESLAGQGGSTRWRLNR